MNEYKKKLAAQTAGKVNTESAQPQMTNGIPNSVLNDVFAGGKARRRNAEGVQTLYGRYERRYGWDTRRTEWKSLKLPRSMRRG